MIENYKVSVSGLEFKWASKFALGLRKKMPKYINIDQNLISDNKYIVSVYPYSKSQADSLVKAWDKVMPANLIIKMEKI